MGTDVTTRAAAACADAHFEEDSANVRKLGVPVPQLNVAHLYETVLLLPRPLGHMPVGRWHFGIPGDPERAARLVTRLIARLAAAEDSEIADQEQADHVAGLRTA